ncbi:hypothetical protein NE237_017004 [Protea cynaroides]|uniref:Uncharacterized protein n=1 Tax=Protea cynaroides TaxID=273540 RepID=A0A9Q0QM91_9MAGN|nr:hypothetical protein NE237_017004 [Protea cynaroides]
MRISCMNRSDRVLKGLLWTVEKWDKVKIYGGNGFLLSKTFQYGVPVGCALISVSELINSDYRCKKDRLLVVRINLNIFLGEESIKRRGIACGGDDCRERTAIELNSIDSSQALRDKELERDLRVSIQNQADEEIMEFRPSRSNVHGDFPDGKRKSWLQLSEVKKLHRRLQILDEDTKAMKKELFAGVDDCNQLLNEICRREQVKQKMAFQTRRKICRGPTLGREICRGSKGRRRG